jgi:hypothetical protein
MKCSSEDIIIIPHLLNVNKPNLIFHYGTRCIFGTLGSNIDRTVSSICHKMSIFQRIPMKFPQLTNEVIIGSIDQISTPQIFK